MQTMSIGHGLDSQDLGGAWRIHPTPASWHDATPPSSADPAWRPIIVPGAWEAQGFPPEAEGPFWYRRDFGFQPGGGDYFLRLHAVSTLCRVYLNGHCLGAHEGIWDGFESKVSQYLVPGENVLALLVQKAGDRLPLRQAVAGFLPDVCVLFGGPWRRVELTRKRHTLLRILHINADAAAQRLTVRVSGEQHGIPVSPYLQLTVLDPAGGEAVAVRRGLPERAGHFEMEFVEVLPAVSLWDPENPNLYTVRITAADTDGPSDQASRRFGWRTLTRQGSRILLNGRPLLLRGLLHWGWYPETVAPTPSRQQIREELLRAREAGFNLIKHCLYVPVDDYFDLADELGILLWQELPLWLPDVTAALKAKVLRQYPPLMEHLHSHPSLLVWSLGCELNDALDGDFLSHLYSLAKEATGDALVRDNSGSGECYGGLLNEHADYYDYHFYTDPHFYRPLMDGFAADWREKKPWLFGEFCDQDTIRDFEGLRATHGGEDPWWLTPPAVADLRRDQSGNGRLSMRLPHSGLADRRKELIDGSRRKDLVCRRTVIEKVRQYDSLAGYVLTGLRDTPLCTSAFLDDFGRMKHPPEEWRRCNDDTILTVAWDNRRDWTGGGDRLCFWDHYNYISGQIIRAHLVISHFGRDPMPCEGINWRFLAVGGRILAEGSVPLSCKVPPGSLAELAVLEFTAPAVDGIVSCRLEAELIGRGSAHPFNAWPLWLYAPSSVTLPAASAVYDPYEKLPGHTLNPSEGAPFSAGKILVTTAWDASIQSLVAAGGCVLYIQSDGGPMPSQRRPFWREALQIFADPGVFAGFTDDGFCGLQWYSLAADRSMSLADLEGFFAGKAQLRPLLRRLDVRQYLLTEYAVEARLGDGRAIITTLRLAGGLGDQASDLSRTVAGQALLARFIRTLLDGF